MKRQMFLLVSALLCFDAAQAESPPPQRAGTPPLAVTSNTPSPAKGNAAEAAAAQEEEYRIGPNDLLELSVFQVKELDRTVRVNTRGVITLPLIGVIQAAGLSATELEERIAEKLKKDYLQDPQVSVFIKEFVSQRITLEGQIEKAGIYPMTGRTTLLQAIALAGGVKELGQASTIKVFHLDKSGAREMQVFDLDAIRSGAIADPTVRNNDIVVVEKSQGRAILKAVTDTLRGFFTLGTL